MEFSWGYVNNLTRVFIAESNITVEDVNNSDVTLDRNNVFGKLFVVNIAPDEIEVPIFVRPAIEEVVRNNLQYPSISNIKKVIVPMYVNSYPQSRRTADSIITDFFTRVDFNQRLQKVTTNKGEVYYGGKGLILDKDFKPLLLCSLVCKKMEHRGRQIMSYYKPVVHVSPQVFLDGNGLISKSILKKVIPLYVSHNILSVNTPSYFRSDIPDNTKPQILIDDVSGYIEEPIKPTPQKCSDEVLNQILIDNIDEVLNQI